MSLKLRPFEGTSDLNYLYGTAIVSVKEITEPVDTDLHDRYKISRANAHVRRYIHLALPCINSLLCGSGHKLAAKLLGIDSSDLEGIAKFSVCMEASTGELMTSTTGGHPGEYLYNGQALLRIIEEFKPTKEIKQELNDIVGGILGDAIFECKQGSGDYQIYGNWYAAITEGIPPEGDMQAKIYETCLTRLRAGKLSRLNMLINLYNSCGSDDKIKEYLSNALIYRALPVIPYYLRPRLAKKDHPLTNAYVRLYNSNNNYSMYVDGTAEDYKEYYKTLYSLVTSVECLNYYSTGELVPVDKDLKQVRPILETIKGKNGMIRGKFLKKRQDYSGRSAVIVDPFMPLNCVGIPRSIVPKLYRHHILNDCEFTGEEVLEKMHDSSFDEHIVNTLLRTGIIEKVPMLLGRNPSLHRHSIQGFHVILVDGRSIKVSPLVCPAFNMDFDGDTAHNEIPLDPDAAYEVEKLILTDRNILLPKTGESTICPRMDIIYGLYTCTRDKYKIGKSIATYDNGAGLKEAIYRQEICVWDTVTVSNMRTDVAGKLAFESCFPSSIPASLPTEEITSKSIKKYIERLQTKRMDVFSRTINQLVELGFKVAYIYCRSVSMLTPLNSDTEAAKEFDQAFENFHKDMEPVNELNDYGYYDPDTYGIEYSQALRKVDEALSAGIYDKVGEASMFTQMAKSGARGNAGNLVQMFGAKGRIQKSDSELFNVTIENGLHQHLTPMEQFLADYGARKGQIAKSIKTADTGYLGRKLAHAAASMIITERDCKTKDGITLDRKEIRSFLLKEGMDDKDREAANDAASDILYKFILGRYQAENGMKIDKNEARRIAYGKSDATVTVRSPLTCKNPCCQRCYGNDASTGKSVAVGTAIGIIAAQSLAEPVTQLTMKEFQSGGTAGTAMSPFDRVNAILSQTDIRHDSKEGRYHNYDPIAWAPGKLIQQEYPGSNTLLQIVPEGVPEKEAAKYNYNIRRIVPEMVNYKVNRFVKLGETLRIDRGDCYAQEINSLIGIKEAQMSIVYTLYFLFRSQVDLVLNHIETIVASMTGHVPILTDVKDLKLGKYYTTHQLTTLGADYRNTEFMSNIRGVGSVINNNVNFLESLIMEDQRRVLSEAVLNCLVDLEDSPLVQMALGQVPKLGTGVNPTFMEDR